MNETETLTDQQKSVIYDGGCFYELKMVEDRERKSEIIKGWKWLKSYGSYNYMPQPFVEITMDEYIQLTHSYSPGYTEHRQVKDVIEGRFPDTTIEWYYKFGIAIVYPGRWTIDKEKKHAITNIVWEEPLRFFYIGCDHKFRELGSAECRERGFKHWGMCWHVVECTKCGYVESYDSSG